MKNRDTVYVLGYIKEHPLVILGIVIVAVDLLLMLVAPWIVPYPPEVPNPQAVLEPPSSEHLLGTDSSGMDVFSRVISAPRTDLSIALIATVLAVLIGGPLGVISGYSRGVLGEVIARGLDIIQTFPPFILAMAAVAMAGQDIRNVIVVLAATNAPMFARLLVNGALWAATPEEE